MSRPGLVSDGEIIGSTALAALAGVTPRRIDHWTRTGGLLPVSDDTPGSGNFRRYSPDALPAARMLAALYDLTNGTTPAFRGAVTALLNGDDTYEIVPGIVLNLEHWRKP